MAISQRIEIGKKESRRPAETVTEDVATFSIAQNGAVVLIRSSGLLQRLENSQSTDAGRLRRLR